MPLYCPYSPSHHTIGTIAPEMGLFRHGALFVTDCYLCYKFTMSNNLTRGVYMLDRLLDDFSDIVGLCTLDELENVGNGGK